MIRSDPETLPFLSYTNLRALKFVTKPPAQLDTNKIAVHNLTANRNVYIILFGVIKCQAILYQTSEPRSQQNCASEHVSLKYRGNISEMPKNTFSLLLL